MTINLVSNQPSVHHQKVEWDVLSRIIAQFAYFEANKTELTARLLIHDLSGLNHELQKTQSYLDEVREEHRQLLNQLLSRLPSDTTLPRYINLLAKEGVLNFIELNRVVLMLETVLFIQQDFPSLKLAEFQQLEQMDLLMIQRKFLREFRHLVDANGEVHFERHPELSENTRKLRELEERIRRTVQEWINEPQHSKLLQFHSYDVHYDRFVVPVRSDSYRSELGLIVSRSESGQTLFVEPFVVRDYCNRRMELIARIDEIINQLVRKFSLALGEFSPLLLESNAVLNRIDFYLAKSGFAFQYRLTKPVIRQQAGFKLTQIFHPLIKKPIKNDVECGIKDHGIVISGPNTGGKTVFLKSLALSYLLFNHGFFVPAEDAELYPYQGLFYFGNDLQDLSVGLSSFSGEVKNYIELIENILSTNLILIDEIFNSTSSDEASALSLAYFNELHARAQCHIVVSTHHQMFKTLVHQDRHYLSCHVGFDTTNMRPTYKIQWGTPGSSMAIDIFRILARQHEIVKDVPANALARLNSKNVSYETLLQRVSQKQIELDQLLNSNRQHEVELKNQKGAMEGVLNLKLQEEFSKARIEVEKILTEARQIVDEARRQEITKTRRIDERSHQLNAKLEQLKGNEVSGEDFSTLGNVIIGQLKPGDIVNSQSLKKEFSVISVDLRRSEVTIGKGPIKFTVPASTLSHSHKTPRQPQVNITYHKNTEARFEHDVRGMRLSEFQNLIDSALGDLLAGDVSYLNIIHGHGDGILKNWLRGYLKRSKDFKGEIPENGNDGETKITIRSA